MGKLYLLPLLATLLHCDGYERHTVAEMLPGIVKSLSVLHVVHQIQTHVSD